MQIYGTRIRYIYRCVTSYCISKFTTRKSARERRVYATPNTRQLDRGFQLLQVSIDRETRKFIVRDMFTDIDRFHYRESPRLFSFKVLLAATFKIIRNMPRECGILRVQKPDNANRPIDITIAQPAGA